MPNEHFCLKWNNFQRNIVAALGNLKLDEDFVDVTISCEGKLIKAHKVILSACSDYFRDLFRENPCQHPVIILRDASYTDVEGLVRYVYRGEVDVQPQQLQSFLKTADALKIKGLADQGLVQDNGQPDLTKSDQESTCNDEDSSPSAFEPYVPSSPEKKIHEPLRVPNFRSNGSSASSSSYEESLPEAKRLRMSPLPLPLNLAPPPSAASTVVAPPSFNTNGNNNEMTKNSNVPLVKNCLDNEQDVPPPSYPPPSQSPLFLHHSPKHISKVETGSIADEETFVMEQRKKLNPSKKKKLKKEKCEVPVSLSNEAESDNNNENNGGPSGNHPRNRWRCMQPRLCNYCWKTFSNSFNLKQHIVNVHIQSQGVTCSLCDKVVKNKWYLRKHLVTAHGAPLKRVTAKKETELIPPTMQQAKPSVNVKSEQQPMMEETTDNTDQTLNDRLSTTC